MSPHVPIFAGALPLCIHDLSGRFAPVRRSTDGREDTSSGVGREPERVEHPVHYPQEAGAPIEAENYKWWVKNDKLNAKRQMLTPLDE